LLAATDRGISVIDFGASRIQPVARTGVPDDPAPLFGAPVLVGRHSGAALVAAYQAPTLAYVFPLDHPGSFLPVGRADHLALAGEGDRWWVQSGQTLTEVDDGGHVLFGPTQLSVPPGSAVVAGSDQDVVVEEPAPGGTAVDVISPGNAHPASRLTNNGRVLGAAGVRIAWVAHDAPSVVRVTTIGGGDRSLQLPAGVVATGPAALHPDGQRVAVFVSDGADHGSSPIRLSIVGPAGHEFVAGEAEERPPGSLVWAMGDRLYWLQPHARQGLTTWQSGDPNPQTARVGTLDVEAITVLQ
jgi:hypothetical protein